MPAVLSLVKVPVQNLKPELHHIYRSKCIGQRAENIVKCALDLVEVALERAFHLMTQVAFGYLGKSQSYHIDVLSQAQDSFIKRVGKHTKLVVRIPYINRIVKVALCKLTYTVCR